MKVKKFLVAALYVVIILSLIAAGTTTQKRVRVYAGDTVNLYLQRSGVHITRSNYSGTLTLSLKDKDPVKDTSLAFLRKLVDARFVDEKGKRISGIQGAVYVYYNVSAKEMRAYENGNLDLYYFDTWYSKWVPCNSFRVYGLDSRLGCRMLNYGLYGLGWDR
jgi:hypothetical protein